MRALTLSLLLCACGGASPAGPGTAPLLEGRDLYTLRYNPPRCLAGASDLHVELRTAEGWERVALEDADREDPLRPRLLERFRAEPAAEQKVTGVLESRVRRWDGNHAARVLILEAVAPPGPVSATSVGAWRPVPAPRACSRRRPPRPATSPRSAPAPRG